MAVAANGSFCNCPRNCPRRPVGRHYGMSRSRRGESAERKKDMSAYIVDIDPETGSIKRTLKNACGGTPPRIGRQPAEREVCGRPGRELIGGVWVCVSHRGAFTAEADLRAAELAAATREHVVPPGRCTFPARGGDSAVPLCGLGAEDRIGTAWACPRHFHEVVEWVRARDRAMEHEARELAGREREAELATRKASGPQVVYYLRATGGAVKIGTSTEFDRRYGTLVREHGAARHPADPLWCLRARA